MATAKEVDSEASSITVEVWHGEKCYELSEIEEQRIFSMKDEGRAELKAWLESLAE
jgi:hypothetical protein